MINGPTDRPTVCLSLSSAITQVAGPAQVTEHDAAPELFLVLQSFKWRCTCTTNRLHFHNYFNAPVDVIRMASLLK
jgi:hypothetical protein